MRVIPLIHIIFLQINQTTFSGSLEARGYSFTASVQQSELGRMAARAEAFAQFRGPFSRPAQPPPTPAHRRRRSKTAGTNFQLASAGISFNIYRRTSGTASSFRIR